MKQSDDTNYLVMDLEKEIFSLKDEITSLKRKLELLDEKYRYAIRKLKMVALELEAD
jgi:hypothetical protein